MIQKNNRNRTSEWMLLLPLRLFVVISGKFASSRNCTIIVLALGSQPRDLLCLYDSATIIIKQTSVKTGRWREKKLTQVVSTLKKKLTTIFTVVPFHVVIPFQSHFYSESRSYYMYALWLCLCICLLVIFSICTPPKYQLATIHSFLLTSWNRTILWFSPTDEHVCFVHSFYVVTAWRKKYQKNVRISHGHIQLQWIKYSYYFGGTESKLIFVIHTFSLNFCDLSSVMYRLFKKKPFSPLIGFKTWMLMLTVHINNEMRMNSNGFRLCQKHWSSIEFFCLKCLHASNAVFNNDKEAEQNRLREHKFHHVRSHWVNI